MSGYQFVVSGDHTLARDTVFAVLQNQGFKVTATDEWSAEAERGSAAVSLVLGAFAGKKGRHIKLSIRFGSDQIGNLTVVLNELTSGASGGLIGAKQATTIYGDIYSEIRQAYQNAGVLLAENPA
jgi:hypothetical protein